MIVNIFKNSNKKRKSVLGFTLIELLGIIVLLAIIALIATPILLDVINPTYKKACQINSKMMEKAAQNYIGLKFEKLPRNDGDKLEITLKQLREAEYITPIKDPKTKELCDEELSKVIITKVGNHFEYKTVLMCTTCLEESGEIVTRPNEVFDGWIRLSLYYPPSSTERKWRLGEEGELRSDETLMWNDYTGAILIPLSRTEDVWISYKLNGKEVVIPPAGRLLVDIDYNPKTDNQKEVTVKIRYDELASVKEYRIGESGWMDYTGEFKVSENVIIEARSKKEEKIYNNEGELILAREIGGRDIVYVKNIGGYNIDEALAAPTIKRLPATNDDEVARVEITYPSEASRKIYKVNYGIEEDYNDIISIKKYGTHVIGYYYNEDGKRSKSVSIYINNPNTSGGSYEEPKEYKPGPSTNNPPTEIINQIPKMVPAPTFDIEPSSSLTESVMVTVNAPGEASKVYIKIGNGIYKEYTLPITVKENTTVSAYYVTYEGYRSDTGYTRVTNIKKEGLPHVKINASPYPYKNSYGASEVDITIEYQDSNIGEYSKDGILYEPYTGSFKVTKNGRIYAKGINDKGTTIEYLDITNIGKYEIEERYNLNVSIIAVKDPNLTHERQEEVEITIEYDKDATKKYYKEGINGEIKEYSGPFKITKNTTIFAYAKSSNGYGEAIKRVDNLNTGIAEPIIRVHPNNKSAYEVVVNIEYDKYATVQRYSINGGNYQDYISPFTISENDVVIRAEGINEFGDKASSTYKISNIIPQPPVVLIDLGEYYILKLNYPYGSTGREYKWKENGEWKEYKEEGILLIKSEYKDDIIKNGKIVKIENENGDKITFKGDYYVLDVPINEINEALFMRWDTVKPERPEIILNTTEPTQEVEVTIIYEKHLIKKEYKIVKPNGEVSEWLAYKGSIKVSEKNTVIYARGMDSSEMMSEEAIQPITNIDNEEPTIIILGNFETPSRSVGVRVIGNDDTGVSKVKYELGTQNKEYFKNRGMEILNNSIISITENGKYTIYVEDYVGNSKIQEIEINNIDKTKPKIDIIVTPEDRIVLEVDVQIEYEDSTESSKEYKIGETGSWKKYSGTINLTSDAILSQGLKNSDNTLTVYARGKDVAGNETVVSKRIVSLDLDTPATPVITSNYGYPILTSYGVVFDGRTTIKFDERNDIDNYYSIDNGATWLPYTGEFQAVIGTVRAKSVKKNSGLTKEATKQISLPSNAMGAVAYDGDGNTYEPGTNKLIKIDSSLILKNIAVKWQINNRYQTIKLEFLKEDYSVIKTLSRPGTDGTGAVNVNTTIPENAKWIRLVVQGSTSLEGRLYEITPATEPTFSAINGYMLLHADPTKAIRSPYQMVSITYFPTSVQRLYRIGTSGEWKNYQNQPIKVNQGATIYAKGINQYGNETRITSIYTANVADAIGAVAYDGDGNTYEPGTNKLIKIDSSLILKNIAVKWQINNRYQTIKLEFLKADYSIISSVSRRGTEGTGAVNINITIPQNAKWIRLVVQGSTSLEGRLYEITP